MFHIKLYSLLKSTVSMNDEVHLEDLRPVEKFTPMSHQVYLSHACRYSNRPLSCVTNQSSLSVIAGNIEVFIL